MKKNKKQFVGRDFEIGQLSDEFQLDRPSLAVLYGRRRVGKTRLLSEFCRDKRSLHFEGLESGDLKTQIGHFLSQLASQTKKNTLAKIKADTWRDVFELITHEISASKRILVFDEFPWMIQKDPKVVALFKYYWDNFWSQKKQWMIILCGSVNTFIVEELIYSSALYGRINHEILLEPLLSCEISEFFGHNKSAKEITDLYMVFGGIPRYLEEINPRESVVQNIQRLCFTKNAFFVKEFDRLFHDEFRKSAIYAKIAEQLAKKGHLNYTELVKNLGSGIGSGYKEYLDNLERARFIEAYTPLNTKDNSRLIRYRLIDEYLLFYFYFIQPNFKAIQQNKGRNFFMQTIGKNTWSAWSGLAFERFCLKHTQNIQEILKIDQLVKSYGPYFNRKTTCNNGFQIDLLFERHDAVISLCEIKYTTAPIGQKIIEDVEKKVALLKLKRNQSVEKVLITAAPPTQSLLDTHYFNRIIRLEEFFNLIKT